MLSEVLWLLALLALSFAVVAFTVYRNPRSLRERLEKKKRRRDEGTRGRRDPPVPDPFREEEDARSALITAFVALGVAVLLGYLAIVFQSP